jgi:catechol 2,3-dioxygenase-like lactoylglutathione lyase family enzyme
MARPVLAQVNLVVADMEATLAFYRRLGVEIADNAPPPWDRHHRNAVAPKGSTLDFDLDSEEFAAQWGFAGTGALLSFRFESREEVDAAYADLVGAGYQGQNEPCDAFWGARFAIVLDPGGNQIGLTSPIDRSFGGPPPEVN